MKKILLIIVCCVGITSVMAQPRIRMRDIVGLTDSIAKKADKSDPRMNNARVASDVPGWAKAATKPTYTPTEVGAAPVVHSQGQSSVTALPDSLLNRYTKAQSDRRYAPYGSTGGGGGGTVDTTHLSNRIDQKADLDDPRFTNARIASDVYPWAKQAVKPTYTPSEVGAAATSHSQTQSTITGLRDTLLNRYTKAQSDLKMADKVGNSDPRLSNARPASDVYPWAKAPVKPSYTASEVGAAATSHSQGQSTIIALPDSLRAKYTRTQTDSRYFRISEAEEATAIFYTKTQVDMMLDSLRQLFVDYIGANPDPPSTTLSNQLISVWEFNETTGTTLADSVHGYNATPYNGALLNQAGKIGRCVTFDGVNDYARVASQVAAFDTLKSAFSIAVWMKTVSKPSQAETGIVFKGYTSDPTADTQWALLADPSGSTAGVSARANSDELTSSYVYHDNEIHLLPGEWHHLVYTYSRTDRTMRIYLDGQLSGTRVTTGDITDCTTSQLTFGSAGGMNFFNVSLDQAAIWSRPLNLAEVQSIYNSGNGKKHQLW